MQRRITQLIGPFAGHMEGLDGTRDAQFGLQDTAAAVARKGNETCQ